MKVRNRPVRKPTFRHGIVHLHIAGGLIRRLVRWQVVHPQPEVADVSELPQSATVKTVVGASLAARNSTCVDHLSVDTPKVAVTRCQNLRWPD